MEASGSCSLARIGNDSATKGGTDFGNHHAHPASARHGLRWFEFDLTWQHVRLLKRLGLASRIRTARYVPGAS